MVFSTCLLDMSSLPGFLQRFLTSVLKSDSTDFPSESADNFQKFLTRLNQDFHWDHLPENRQDTNSFAALACLSEESGAVGLAPGSAFLT